MTGGARRAARMLGIALWGLAFGATLALVGFGDARVTQAMFALRDLRLLLTFCGAVGVMMLLRVIFRRPPQPLGMPRNRGLIPGAALFGAGWALLGACPGAALVMLGGGLADAPWVLLGMVGGVWVGRRVGRRLNWVEAACAAD